MTLKTVALLALVGTLLLTVTSVLALIRNLSLLAAGGVAMISVLDSLVYAFFAISLLVFFFVFHKAQG